MSIHDAFIDKVLRNPQWEIIRDELCPPDEAYEHDTIEISPGAYIHSGGIKPGYEQFEKTDGVFTKLCWYVNSGPGYCEDAPPHIKVYLRRLGVKV